jgi:hypothetical protein
MSLQFAAISAIAGRAVAPVAAPQPREQSDVAAEREALALAASSLGSTPAAFAARAQPLAAPAPLAPAVLSALLSLQAATEAAPRDLLQRRARTYASAARLRRMARAA